MSLRLHRQTLRLAQLLNAALLHMPWLLLALWLPAMPASAQDNFLPPEKAFRVSAYVSSTRQVQLVWEAAPATYLYKDKFAVTGVPASIHLGALTLPTGHRHFDEALGKEVESLRGQVSTALTFSQALPPQQPAWIKVVYQGCADAGLCYPPQTRFFQLTVNQQGAVTHIAPAPDPAGDAAVPPQQAADNPVEVALAAGNLPRVAVVCLLAGVLLSLTPCVWPMLPILSSIIVGQKEAMSRARGFLLALAYSQGMALVYTLLGVAAGLLGQGLTAYLQHPWVLLSFAVLMVLLALSMFGLYELQLPARVQSGLAQGAQKLPGGQFVSVFLMGSVSALVVSPCVSAPLAGALLYIGQSGNVWLGGTALYAMAWGMSLPLLLVGLSMGGLLPKAGRWMVLVKALCGVLILALAAWMVRPAWPFIQGQITGKPVSATHVSALPFQRVSTPAQLDNALQAAAQTGRVVMLDFYADWCVACIEMEQTTFRDPAVQRRLQNALLLQVDVTAHTTDDRALLERFHLFGPPGILFFAPGQSTEPGTPNMPNVRVIGYQNAERFQQALQAAGL
jgi:thioredoxin:protein disulfide reductase